MDSITENEGSRVAVVRYETLKKLLGLLAKHSAHFRSQSHIQKEDQSPVTELDITNQYVIETVLSQCFPMDTLLAEEKLSSDYAMSVIDKYQDQCAGLIAQLRPGDLFDEIGGYTWFIDPIDGTKGFLDNLSYSIAIAVVRGASLVCSGIASMGLKKVLSLPLDTVVACTNGEQIETMDDSLKPVLIPCPENTTMTVAISRKHRTSGLGVILHSNGYSLIELDSQTKYLVVLLGWANSYIREAGCCGTGFDMTWDHLPGIHLITTNNGYVADINNSSPDFSSNRKEIRFEKYLISSNSFDEYEEILRILENRT